MGWRDIPDGRPCADPVCERLGVSRQPDLRCRPSRSKADRSSDLRAGACVQALDRQLVRLRRADAVSRRAAGAHVVPPPQSRRRKRPRHCICVSCGRPRSSDHGRQRCPALEIRRATGGMVSDSRRIAYLSEGQWHVVGANGKGARSVPWPTWAPDPGWSPDHRWLAPLDGKNSRSQRRAAMSAERTPSRSAKRSPGRRTAAVSR